jgi:hypothetical protein
MTSIRLERAMVSAVQRDSRCDVMTGFANDRFKRSATAKEVVVAVGASIDDTTSAKRRICGRLYQFLKNANFLHLLAKSFPSGLLVYLFTDRGTSV